MESEDLRLKKSAVLGDTSLEIRARKNLDRY
jgi:hypothetical protein